MNELQRLMDEVSEWQHKTFETVECVNISRHLEKEAKELTEALENYYSDASPWTNANVDLEFADCITLLVACAKRKGLTADRLIELGFEKFEINKRRKWGKQNEDGTYSHIKEIPCTNCFVTDCNECNGCEFKPKKTEIK